MVPPNKHRRRKHPDATPPLAGANAQPTQGHAEPDVRLSMRLLGLWVAAIPFAVMLWSGANTSFLALKWPVAALGTVVFIALAWREQLRRAAQPDISALALRTWILGEPFLTGAALIAVGLTLSSIFSPVPGLGLLTTLRESVFLLLAVGLFVHRPRPGEIRWIMICLLVTAGVQSALAIAQGFFPSAMDVLTPGIATRTGRAAMIGTMGNPEYLASWVAPAVAASVALLISRRLSPGEKTVVAVVALLGAAMIFLSGGRGAILSAGAGLAIAFFVFRPGSTSAQTNGRFKLGLIVGGGLAGVAALAGVALLAFMSLGSPNANRTNLANRDANEAPDTRRGMLPRRIASTLNLHSASMRHRVGLYTITGRMITRDPIFGAGPGRFSNAFARTQGELARDEQGIGFWALNDIISGHYSGSAHCDPLQWWAEYGLLPFLGLTLMIMRALTGAANRLRQSRPHPDIWLIAVWVALLVTFGTMWTSFPLHLPDRALTFWVLLALLAGASTKATRPGNNKC